MIRSMVPVGPEHAEVLAALHMQGFEDAWDAPGLLGIMNTPGTFGFMAVDEFPLGFGLARVVLDETEILTLVVARQARAAGHGAALLEALMVGARARGAIQMFLEVALDNPSAIRLYRRHGFETAGKRIGYYARPSGSVDGWIMQRGL